jgi:hypothetical protein
VVQVGTASFKRMVDMAIVTEHFINGQIQGTGTPDLVDFKHAAPSALSQTTVAESRRDELLPLCASHIREMPVVRFDGAGHIIMK